MMDEWDERKRVEKEREMEFYLTPDKPGHKAADAAESSERSMHVGLSARQVYVQVGGDHSIYITKLYR